MTTDELIARQAMQIEELRDDLSNLKTNIDNALSHLYCVGGPLNDNKLEFNQKQQAVFQLIAGELNYGN